MKKSVLLTLLALLLSFALVACNQQNAGTDEKKDEKQEENKDKAETENKEETKDEKKDELEKITFVLDWTPNTNHTGLYVAQEKGFFKDAGFDVTLVQPGEGGSDLMVSTSQGQFGVSFQDYVVHGLIGENPLNVTTVATILQHNTSGIISRKGEGMDRPKGMEGKTYATWDMPVEKAMIKEVVEKDGGDFSKIVLQPNNVTDEVAALKSKSVDAIWVFYGWAGIATQIAELETDYFAFSDISPVLDYYTPVIIANNDYLKNNPDRAKAFLNAVKQGYEFAIEQPEEAARILLKAAPELDETLAIKSQEYLSPLYKAEVERWGYIDPERWDNFFAWLYEKKLIDVKLDKGAGFTNDYLPE